jgi:ubiquinone/menaquinone biosynthesis C-methylase UbiE
MKKHEHSGCTKKTFDNPKEILLLAGIEKGNSLLDIGTGSGYFSIVASEIVGADGIVYALDIHEASIDALKQELSDHDKGITNIKPILADIVKGIPLPRDIIDVCLMSNVVHGFVANEEIDKVLRNTNVVLKEDGKLVIIDFNKTDASFGPPVSIRLSPDEVEDIVSPYGYALKNKFDIGLAHYAIVFQRICLQDKHC